ncbi:MAG TPA: hypothetical protein VJI68_02470 [Candidatus Nanoarchaeia archaeon]|nr:hypothetical protein [Candidatus Nanoarchaeia archaeon]
MEKNTNLTFEIIIEIVIALVLGLIINILGFIVGATFGGNFGFFNYNGVPGYEAGGLFIGIIGFAIGVFLSTIISAEIFKIKGSIFSAFIGCLIGAVITLILNIFSTNFYLLLITMTFPIIGSILGLNLKKIYKE